MRLLQRNDNGEFKLTRDFVGDDVTPPYAILSHTWGVDTEEVTFEDITCGTGKAKQGLQKLQFCEEQARKNGLQYFWVDTCCINKSSSAELTQAINSMFRWYRHAARCYVYLSDVSSLFNYDGSMTVPNHLAFQESRWFKRGWTLQELLAPSSVEFFSREGKKLGDKSSLGRQISAITSIPDAALQGASLSQFSIEERLSWINHRQTKLGEDKAYSLLGIFDVYIPLIYGEGQDHAFIRLRKAIEESPKNGSHALPLALSTPQPRQRRNRDLVTQTHKSGVMCYKCHEPGHYANEHCSKCGEYGHDAEEPHCYKCGEHGHYANEPHCYKCGEYGHYANEPHCYRFEHPGGMRDHVARECTMHNR